MHWPTNILARQPISMPPAAGAVWEMKGDKEWKKKLCDFSAVPFTPSSDLNKETMMAVKTED